MEMFKSEDQESKRKRELDKQKEYAKMLNEQMQMKKI